MRTAIIRLSKRILVDSKTEDPGLARLREWISRYLKRLEEYGELEIVLSHMGSQRKDEMSIEVSKTADAILKQFLQNRLPGEKNVASITNPLVIEKCKVEIAKFTGRLESLVFWFYAISEELIALDAIGTKLVLAKKDQLELIKSGKKAAASFLIDLTDEHNIVEYLPLQ